MESIDGRRLDLYMGDYGMAGLKLPKVVRLTSADHYSDQKMTFNHNVAHGHETNAELLRKLLIMNRHHKTTHDGESAQQIGLNWANWGV